MKNKKNRKWRREHKFEGRVRNKAMQVMARTKREATAKLRLMFSAAGLPTRPSGLEDLLSVYPVTADVEETAA